MKEDDAEPSKYAMFVSERIVLDSLPFLITMDESFLDSKMEIEDFSSVQMDRMMEIVLVDVQLSREVIPRILIRWSLSMSLYKKVLMRLVTTNCV